MSQGQAHQQELEHQEYLLTLDSVFSWIASLTKAMQKEILHETNNGETILAIYKQEHGLPSKSEIKF